MDDEKESKNFVFLAQLVTDDFKLGFKATEAACKNYEMEQNATIFKCTAQNFILRLVTSPLK